MPYGNHEIINKIKYVTNDFYIKNSRKPTIEELSEILDISKVTIENVLKNFLSTQTCSLKKFSKFEDDEEVNFERFISDNVSLEDDFVKNEMPNDLFKLLEVSNLTKREKEVLFLRNGFYNDKLYTLEEVSKIYNLTKERIRQIEADALQKIRAKKDVYNLIDYTDNESKSREYILKSRENYYSKKRHIKTDSNFIKSDIYDFFPELDKNEVDKQVIEKLSLDDLEILHIRFGDDFNNPILNKNWTKEEQKSFYKLIYREKAKVKRYIKNRKKNS